MRLRKGIKTGYYPGNARYWHNGSWTGNCIMLSYCDDDWACWSNPWPWGGVATTYSLVRHQDSVLPTPLFSFDLYHYDRDSEAYVFKKNGCEVL